MHLRSCLRYDRPPPGEGQGGGVDGCTEKRGLKMSRLSLGRFIAAVCDVLASRGDSHARSPGGRNTNASARPLESHARSRPPGSNVLELQTGLDLCSRVPQMAKIPLVQSAAQPFNYMPESPSSTSTGKLPTAATAPSRQPHHTAVGG